MKGEILQWFVAREVMDGVRSSKPARPAGLPEKPVVLVPVGAMGILGRQAGFARPVPRGLRKTRASWCSPMEPVPQLAGKPVVPVSDR